MADHDDEWTDKTVDITELKLDLQNPRLPKHVKEHNDETQIRNYLLEKEGIVRIARSISNNGYHRSAVSIAYEDGGKYVVLDGNRRLAASQLLSNPNLVPTPKEKREFEDLAKKLTATSLSAIKVTVAPSRKAAEKEIWDIHVTQLSKPWEVLQKLRMYKNLIDTGAYTVKAAAFEYGITETKFKSELARLYFYEKLLEITDDDGEEELLKSGFNKIQRLILSKNGKKLLDYTVGDTGEVLATDNDTFNANLKLLEPYITDPTKIGAQAKQEELEDLAYSKIDPKMFPPAQQQAPANTTIKAPPIQKTPTPPATAPAITPPGTHSKPDWISDTEYKQYQGANRVKNMLEELKKNRPTKKQNLNIVAVSLRVIIELAVYDKLSSRGSIRAMVNEKKEELRQQNVKRVAANQTPYPALKNNWTPSLKEMLAFMTKEASGVITDPQERKALERLTQTKKDFVADMDNFIHNVSYTPTEDIVKDIWETFCRLVFDILKKI